MNDNELKSVFHDIANRIKTRKDSLSEIKKLEKKPDGTKGMGIEGWLQVETVKAIGGGRVIVQNKGADLLLNDGTEIELKAMSNFSITENSLNKGHQANIYIFLCDFDDKKEEKLEKLRNMKTWELVSHREFNDGFGDWIIFMMKFRE